jgi:nucleotide-binding universal stress UspA family protein
MTIVVAVPDSPEGTEALAAAIAEAKLFNTDVVAVNLALHPLLHADFDEVENLTIVDRVGRDDRDPVDAVIDEVLARDAIRLVIGVKRRSRVGKAVLGSISQRLLMASPIPVLAVKLD